MRNETGWSNGLVVVLGDAALALDLARDARQLVLWLSSDPQAVQATREQILAAGLQGILTAEVCSPGQIPLRGELANVVVVDADAVGAGAPDDAELRRVLIPSGSIYRKTAGRWKHQATPWPADYGTWTHIDANATGNPVANDKVATVPKGMQWIGSLGSNKHNGTDPFIERDSLVVDYAVNKRGYSLNVEGLKPDLAERKAVKAVERRHSGEYRAGRDAFNGLPRWVHLYQPSNLSALALGGGRAYFPVAENFYGKSQTADRFVPLSAVDLRTGEVNAVFSDAPQIRMPLDKKAAGDPLQVVYDRNRVYITAGPRLAACDAATAKVLWTVEAEGPHLGSPTVSPDGKTLYCLDGDAPPKIVRFFGQRQIRAIVSVDTATGKVKWRSPVTSSEASQVIALDDGVLVARQPHHGWNVGGKGKGAPYTAGVDRIDATGKTSWTVNRVPGKGSALGDGQIGNGGLNMAVMGDAVFVAEHWRTVRINLASGEATSFGHPNIGCQRMFGLRDQLAYANLVLWNWPYGQTMPEWTYVGIAHPECGSGFSVANGRFYIRTMGMCDCNFHLRPAQSFHCQEPPAAVDDARRLTPGAKLAGPVTTVPAPAPAGHKDALIRAEWRMGYYGDLASYWAPVVARDDDTLQGESPSKDGVTFVPLLHSQRLEARKGDALVWAQQLGGRPAGQPVLAGGHVIQASRDGYVYAFDPATGAPRWRFLAARCDQRLVNSGQIESVWPCVGAVLHEGVLAVPAGISPELDGGGMVWGLDPATGAIKWKVALVTPAVQSGPVAGAVGQEKADFVGFHGGGDRGAGFPLQGVRVVHGKVCVGYRRTTNFGSHGAPYWAWVAVDPAEDREVNVVARWKAGAARSDGKLGKKPPATPAGPRLSWYEHDDGSITETAAAPYGSLKVQ